MPAEWALRQVRSVAERENPNWSEDHIQRLANQRTAGTLDKGKLRKLGRVGGNVRSGGDAPGWASRQVSSVADRLGLDWTAQEREALADQIATGGITTSDLQQMGADRVGAMNEAAVLQAEQQAQGMDRSEYLQTQRALFPWLNEDLMRVFEDAYVEYGQNQTLLLQEVRNGEGRQVYDQVFAGNRREDGTLRLSEAQYMSTVAQYRNSLQQRGLNPDMFESRFSELIENEVSADEFEGRVTAVNEQIAMQSDEIRQAFAEASGVDDFTPEATLATVLDPEGVGRELLERRIGIAQIQGAAAESGFQRSSERANLLSQRGVGLQQARQFFSGARQQARRLSTASMASRGERGVGVRELEAASLLGDQEAARNLSQLFARENAQFRSQRGMIGRSRSGALTGLGAPRR